MIKWAWHKFSKAHENNKHEGREEPAANESKWSENKYKFNKVLTLSPFLLKMSVFCAHL